MADFKLSASLVGHEDDVRAVAFPSSKAALSASRDGTVRLWKLLSAAPPTFDPSISSHSTAFVNALAFLPGSPEYPDGLIISGGKDALVEVRQPDKVPSDNAEALLIGHSHNICALDVDPAGKFIVSGSWDASGRVWRVGKWECEAVLEGHEGSVWAVLAYDSETIITGCADKLIRVFHISGKLLRTIRGSEDVVRALCRVPKGHPSGADFASASNDGVIRLWTISGQQVGELHGHASFIYSLGSLPTGELVSSGEDRTVKIWRGYECIQTITHPAISVWGVAVCAETGDIISGASDKIARIFTRSPERFAEAEQIRQFEESVKESSIPQQQLGDINKEKLPGPEFLTQKSGTKEGQVQMIRQPNGSITAHTWSAAQREWVNVGTVVDAVGSSGKKVEYGGKEYDYVFDVDIEDGKPPLKLPYNLSQNPYEAATKFIENNKLPISYLDTVANFLITNTQGATLGQSQQQSQPGSDPWGTESRYRPGDSSSTQQSSFAPPPSVLPQKEYLNITVARYEPMQKKIEELNQKIIGEGHKDLSLNPAEISTLHSLRKHLEAAGVTKTTQSIAGGLDLAVKLVTQWPYGHRLPGLDLLRLLCVAPDTATYRGPNGENIIDVLITGATESSSPAENNIMMAIRAFANLFDSSEGRDIALKEYEKIQGVVSSALSKATTNRNLLVAATTLYINYAVLFQSTNADDGSFEYILAILDTLNQIIGSQNDSEVVYRGMVALGTLLAVGEEVVSAAKDIYGVKSTVDAAVGKASDARIKRVGGEIKKLLA
ncbi:WD40-repeat-containing domain protein [Xylogone sp. PMI_703]|nr:WD40-repeat-containing domain protein [Xylogone sp. PMI_703]